MKAWWWGIGVCLLAGCASNPFQAAIQQRNEIFAPKKLFAPAVTTAIEDGCSRALTAASTDSTRVPAFVDACNAANAIHCGNWIGTTSMAERKRAFGNNNAGVIENAITAGLGALKASSAAVAGYGIAATAYEGFDSNIRVLLAPSQWATQSVLRSMLGQCSAALTAEATGMAFATAIGRLEECEAFCSPEAAQNAATQALSATKFTITPASGAVTVAPK